MSKKYCITRCSYMKLHFTAKIFSLPSSVQKPDCKALICISIEWYIEAYILSQRVLFRCCYREEREQLSIQRQWELEKLWNVGKLITNTQKDIFKNYNAIIECSRSHYRYFCCGSVESYNQEKTTCWEPARYASHCWSWHLLISFRPCLPSMLHRLLLYQTVPPAFCVPDATAGLGDFCLYQPDSTKKTLLIGCFGWSSPWFSEQSPHFVSLAKWGHIRVPYLVHFWWTSWRRRISCLNYATNDCYNLYLLMYSKN